MQVAGWTLSKGEEDPLSDIALMWMLREAKRAGMPFDESKLEGSHLFSEDTSDYSEDPAPKISAPVLQVEGESLSNRPDMLTSSG